MFLSVIVVLCGVLSVEEKYYIPVFFVMSFRGLKVVFLRCGLILIFVTTTGGGTLHVVKNYIEDQKRV